MYGPSTVFAYTTGKGLHGFTLDEDIGEFVLTHPGICCPESGAYYSANLANVPTWPSNARRYIEYLTDSTQAAHAYSLRYAGALAAEVHRTVLEGGIYLYPCDKSHPEGKLRLLYECAPLAFVIEQAGGAASTGRAPVLDVPIGSIHQRVPLRDRQPGRGGALRRVHGERRMILVGDVGGTKTALALVGMETRNRELAELSQRQLRDLHRYRARDLSPRQRWTTCAALVLGSPVRSSTAWRG